MENRYKKLTNEVFDEVLDGIVNEMTPQQILAIPGVYDILREEFNNEVLDQWEDRQPDNDYECKDCGNEWSVAHYESADMCPECLGGNIIHYINGEIINGQNN